MGPDYCYFKVKGEDGNLYILRMDMGRAEWELTDNVISIRRLLDETTALSPFWIPRVRFMAEFIERECRPLCRFLGRPHAGAIRGQERGVGEAPRHEIARYGARRLSVAYGDLAAPWL